MVGFYLCYTHTKLTDTCTMQSLYTPATYTTHRVEGRDKVKAKKKGVHDTVHSPTCVFCVAWFIYQHVSVEIIIIMAFIVVSTITLDRHMEPLIRYSSFL